jgi:peptide/nickel transport system substrate-binding protein
MKEMRRPLALMLAVAMMASLASCGGGSTTSDDAASPEASQAVESTAAETTTAEALPSNDVTSAEGEAVYGGTLNMTMQTLQLDCDPSASDSYKWELWNERLFTIDITLGAENYQDETSSSSRMTGQIADSWEWDASTQTFTVTIRDDVYFQDKASAGMGDYDVFGGRQLTAEDVVYTYDRLLGIGTCSEPVECDENWASDLYMIESVEAVDDYTVAFHFNTNTDLSASDFMLVNVNITGPEWDTLTDDQKSDWHYAVGTGAYVLTDYSLNSYASFTKSQNYYDTDTREGYEGNALPYLDEINMSVISENANQITQFIAGNQDIIGWNKSYLSDSECQLLRDTLSADDYNEYVYLGQPTCICLKISANEPLQDVRVREAMQMAINVDEINSAYYGFTTEAQVGGLFSVTTDYSSVDNWSDELKATWTYDPEGAKELLAEAGYADGFTFQICTISDYTELFTLVQEYLAQVGITMEITTAADSLAMEVYGSDRDDPNSIPGAWGMGSTFFASIMWSPTGPQYNSFNDDDNVVDFFDRLNAAASEDEVNQIAQEFDQYMAEQHYALVVSPYSHCPVFVSSKIGGLDSSFMYANVNCYTLLTHCWDTTAG